jgi:hypothetical protein
MAAWTGVPAIKRLIISLAVIGLIMCGAIYAIVRPPEPVIKPVASDMPSRTLAYQQQIARPNETAPAAETEAKPQQQAMAPAAPAPANPAATVPPQSAPAPKPQAAAPAAQPEGAPSDMAGLPPDGEESGGPESLPWQHPSERPYGQDYPEDGNEAPGPVGAWPGEDGYQQDGYQQDGMGPMPGDDADPNAWPAPQADQGEWVQVLISGAGMYGMAADDAPMLFAFPSGRTLKVISRYGNWVEVTDPQSTTTGWMKAQYLAPAAAPGSPQEADNWYDDEQPRHRRGGFFRRLFGGGF